jgi:hypothetical protein
VKGDMTAAQYRKKAGDEHAIQVSIIQFLDRTLPSFVRAVAVSNKPRSRIQGYLEKQRGARTGFPDIIILREGGISGLIEVKKEGGRLSQEQIEWRDWCGGNAIPYAVVRSVEDVQQTLKEWCILTGEADGSR